MRPDDFDPLNPDDFDAFWADAGEDLRELLRGLLADCNMATDDGNELALRVAMRAFAALAMQNNEAQRVATSAIRFITTLWPNATTGLTYRGQQRLRASHGSKLTPAQKLRALDQYNQRERNGQKYGAVKALAAAFNVSTKTMSSIVSGKKNRK